MHGRGVIVGALIWLNVAHGHELINWEPRDSVAVKRQAEIMLATSDPADLDVFLDVAFHIDPLKYVPDSRLRDAFPGIGPKAKRLSHCAWGLGSDRVTTIEFTPAQLGNTTVRRNRLRCYSVERTQASSCTLEQPTAYFIGEVSDYFTVSDSTDVGRAFELIELIHQGAYRTEVDDFAHAKPPNEIRDLIPGMSVHLVGGEAPRDTYVLTFPGCGCDILTEAELRTHEPKQVVFTSYEVVCN